MKRYIAVDLGASSGRVVVGNLHEFTVTNRFVTRNDRVNGSVYWDILYIFSEIKEGLKKAFSLFPGEGEISGISIDTWGVDYGLLDAHGALMGLPYHYRDARTDGMMEEVFAKISREEIYKETGIQFMQLNTIYQLAAMKKYQPELLGVAKTYLSVPDLLNFWLCGVAKNEFSHVSTTQLYNPETKDWSWKIIDALDLPRDIFCEIIPSGTVLGPLRPEVAAKIGAPSSVQVIAGGSHDTAAAVAAVPVVDDKPNIYISSGTWSLLGIESDEPIITEKSLAYNFTNEGAASGKVRFMKNIMGMWIQQECLRWWEAAGETITFKDLDAETLACADFPSTIDPNDNRFLKPNSSKDPMPKRVEDYCRENNLPVPVKKGEFMAVIYRGLAEAYARYARQLSDITGVNYEHLYVIGGGCKNFILNQWTADASGIRVSAGPVEATALGNILIQALALNDIPDKQAGRKLIRKYHEYTIFEPTSP